MEAGLILGIFVMIVFIMGLRKHRKQGEKTKCPDGWFKDDPRS